MLRCDFSKKEKNPKVSRLVTLTFIRAHIYYYSGNEYLKELSLLFFKEEEFKKCCASYAYSKFVK